MAKRAKRWGVHFEIPSQHGQGLYKRRSSYCVRGRNIAEAYNAAIEHPRYQRMPFIVIMLD